MNENEIRAVLGEGIGEEPPVVGGPAAVFAGARTRTARTRALTGALSAVAVLGVAAGAVAFSGGSHGAAKASQAVAPGAVATDASPSTKTPSPAPSTSLTPKAAATSGVYRGHGQTHNPAPTPGAGQVLMDGRSVGEILKSLMPAGLVTGNYAGQDSYEHGKLGVSTGALMSLDDGSGKLTTVNASVVENNHFAFADENCPTLQGFDSHVVDCRTEPQPDGSVILLYRHDDDVSPTVGPTQGSYALYAARAFPNGMYIMVRTSNYFDSLDGPHEKGWHVSPTRSTVLLTTDQLKAMLSDSRWGLTVSAQFAQQARRDLMPYTDQTQKD